MNSQNQNDDEDEDVEVMVKEEEVDDSICIVCNGTTYIGETISCETCLLWFHFQCVGVSHDDDVVKKEDVPFYCSSCINKKTTSSKKPQQKTTVLKPKKPIGNGSNKKKPKPPLITTSSPDKKVVSPTVLSKGLKLKISLKSPPLPPPPQPHPPPQPPQQPQLQPQETEIKVEMETETTPKRKKKEKSEDEEEKWLDAVESGNLNVIVDPELKNIKDPKLMTARQRAMLERQKTGEEVGLEEAGHIALGYGSKNKGEAARAAAAAAAGNGEEFLKLKALKTQKRKELELQRRENDKKKTLDRLLKKKDSKAAKHLKTNSRRYQRDDSSTSVTYRVLEDGSRMITMPEDYHCDYLTTKRPPIEPPKPIFCSVCSNNPKKYSCSKTGKPLCSLSCYRIAAIKI